MRRRTIWQEQRDRQGPQRERGVRFRAVPEFAIEILERIRRGPTSNRLRQIVEGDAARGPKTDRPLPWSLNVPWVVGPHLALNQRERQQSRQAPDRVCGSISQNPRGYGSMTRFNISNGENPDGRRNSDSAVRRGSGTGPCRTYSAVSRKTTSEPF